MDDGLCSNAACKKYVGIHDPSSIFFMKGDGDFPTIAIDPVHSSWETGFKSGGGGLLGEMHGCCGKNCFEAVLKGGMRQKEPAPRNRIARIVRRKPTKLKAAV